jgi:hypothetical protein
VHQRRARRGGVVAGERGQASAELLAVLPLLLVALLAVGQLAVAGYALWSAGDAARAGARAVHVGGDPEEAARSAVPEWLEQGVRVDEGGEGEGPVEVELRAPALIPGAPPIPVRARANLEPEAADG